MTDRRTYKPRGKRAGAQVCGACGLCGTVGTVPADSESGAVLMCWVSALLYAYILMPWNVMRVLMLRVYAIACCCKIHSKRHVHDSLERVLQGQNTCTEHYPLKVHKHRMLPKLHRCHHYRSTRVVRSAGQAGPGAAAP